MFLLVGEPRKLMDNPEYHVDRASLYVPTYEDHQARLVESHPEAKLQIIKSDNPEIPDTVRREYTETPTGRLARGSLEQNVKEACDAWIKEGGEEDCTTLWVADWISENLGVLNTSRGAIDACWKRWMEDLKFAIILRKPTRFVFYTPEGLKLGLEGIKAKHDRERRAKQISQKLGRRD
jgi:hypothetical protein